CNYEWLIEQAERVQELEEQNIKYRTFKNYDNLETLANFSKEIKRLEQQNKRYQEALEFYADKDEYYAKINFFDDDKSRYGEVYLDEGQTAREALDERSNR